MVPYASLRPPLTSTLDNTFPHWVVLSLALRAMLLIEGFSFWLCPKDPVFQTGNPLHHQYNSRQNLRLPPQRRRADNGARRQRLEFAIDQAALLQVPDEPHEVGHVIDGRTLGKRALGLRIRPLAADVPLTWGQVVVRWGVFEACSIVLGGLPLLLDCLWPLWDKPWRQALHDKTARTVTTKLRYPDFAIRTRSTSLPAGTDDAVTAARSSRSSRPWPRSSLSTMRSRRTGRMASHKRASSPRSLELTSTPPPRATTRPWLVVPSPQRIVATKSSMLASFIRSSSTSHRRWPVISRATSRSSLRWHRPAP